MVIFGLGTVGLSVCIGIIINLHLYMHKPFTFSYYLRQIWTNNLYDQVAQGAKVRGASRIIGVDTNPEKCEKGTLDIL